MESTVLLNKSTLSSTFSLSPADNERLANLCGLYDEHIHQVENYFGVEIKNRGNLFHITGQSDDVENAGRLLNALYLETENNQMLTPTMIHLLLQEHGPKKSRKSMSKKKESDPDIEKISIHTKSGGIKPRTYNQALYIQHIRKYDINFGEGPAGTGKTYLSVLCAVDALEKGLVQRILLVRPAVEAGEKLGFLPGDIAQKVDPYLRPLYDALYEMLGVEKVTKLIEQNIIEIAPLAYMRGRSLNNAFIILDEGQNTTKQQMKMFLTRVGFDSTAVINGDLSQVDLPHDIHSGLRHAMHILQKIKGVGFTQFDAGDVVRHPLVQDIIQAYDKYEKSKRSS